MSVHPKTSAGFRSSEGWGRRAAEGGAPARVPEKGPSFSSDALLHTLNFLLCPCVSDIIFVTKNLSLKNHFTEELFSIPEIYQPLYPAGLWCRFKELTAIKGLARRRHLRDTSCSHTIQIQLKKMKTNRCKNICSTCEI